MRLRYLAAALALALLCPRTVLAADAAAAEALFQEAKQLADAGKYAEACPKFEASYRADRTLGTLLNLANCHEKVGQIASAWAEWNEAIEMTKKLGDEREKYATDRRDKLTARLPKLEVRVSKNAEGLEVFRGEVRVPSGAYNVALPADPGDHEITVRRGDAVLERRKVTLAEAKTETIELDLAAIDQKHPAPKPVPGTGGGTGPGGGDTARETSSQKTIGFIVGGVGVAALLTAGVLEVIAISNKSKADEPDQCVNKYCSPEGLETADRAKTFAEIGQWVGIGGFVLTAVGLTLVLTSPSSEQPSRARLGVSPWVGHSAGGLSVKGTL